MYEDLKALCLRLERAQAGQNMAICQANGGSVLGLLGGIGVYYGPGHFMNQGLALGLEEPLGAESLDRLEAHLAPEGGEVVVEVAAGVDSGCLGLLAERGYRLRQFQQVWQLRLDSRPREPALEVRVAAPQDGFAAVVMAGFMNLDDPRSVDATGVPFTEGVFGTKAFLAFLDGGPVAGGTVSVVDGVAVLSGTSVLPRFRGRGIQKAVIAARLAWAHDQGARTACSATLPGTASQASLERLGFRVAYPKVELARILP
jgi:GNAT superfamily N-acetyltransferase